MNHSNINLSGPTPSDDYLDHDDDNHCFTNKCMPMKTLDNTDYMIVSSEAIIDILDLTNDEVEQILDDNLISSQDFEMLNSPRLSQSSQSYNRMPRINLATNLTKVTSPQNQTQSEGKCIDMRPLETPTISLVSTMSTTATAANEIDADTNDTTKLITMPISVNRKKSGRTKGARQISMFSNFISTLSTHPIFLHDPIPTTSSIGFCSFSFSFKISFSPSIFSRSLQSIHFSINFITFTI